MRVRSNSKITSLLLCVMLIVAMALTTTGCNGNLGKDPLTGTQTGQTTEQNTEIKTTVLGQGATKFLFTVVDKEGKETRFEIHTDKKMVGEALMELKLIEGEEEQFGLYVKKVNGITADYDTDGTYWAFYVNGEYASSGVDTTQIREGDTYSFKVGK